MSHSDAAVIDASEYFDDRCEFFDDVLGAIFLNQVERDCVDSPEFQRLFRIQQLGFVDLLYHTANHTRGIHSIGACARSKHLVDRLNANTPRIVKARRRSDRPLPRISPAERSLISLAGLLHDLPHGPLSHDIEKKTHRYERGTIKVRSFYGPYDKHDDFARNPALYLMLFDKSHSILARVLEHYSKHFWEVLQRDAHRENGAHLAPFIAAAQKSNWDRLPDELLTALLFHLLAVEDLHTARQAPTLQVAKQFGEAAVDWGIGPEAHRKTLHETWYQPYRHDIVGNTLSADLLDYLARDGRRMGMQNALDPKLLEYYVLVDIPPISTSDPVQFSSLARCAIDLNDYKRGVIRHERINDVFRMLDFRHEIHEKAVYHRVVQSAISMAARAVSIAGDQKPSIESLYGIGEPLHALWGDDYLLRMLADGSNDASGGRAHHRLAQKLIERRVYRPLMVIPGDQANELLGQEHSHTTDTGREETLRRLGAILDSTYFAPLFCLVCWCVERLLDHSLESAEEIDNFIQADVISGGRLEWARKVMPRRVILWTTPYKQLYKDPAIVVRAGEHVGRIDELAAIGKSQSGSSVETQLPSSLHARIQAGLRDSESRYASMWRIYVFISDGLYYAGGLARLLPDHPCRTSSASHKAHLEDAQDCIIRAVLVAWRWWATNGRLEREDLNEPIKDGDLKQILQMYVAGREWHKFTASETRKAVSAVDIDQYLHLESDEHCRDIRYKFDKTGSLDECLTGVSKEAETTLREVLLISRVDVAELGHEELADIVSHLVNAELGTEAVAEAAETGSRMQPDSLRRAWFTTELKESSRHGTAGDGTVSRTTQTPEPPIRSGRNRRESQRKAPQIRLLEDADSLDESGERVSDSANTDNSSKKS